MSILSETFSSFWTIFWFVAHLWSTKYGQYSRDDFILAQKASYTKHYERALNNTSNAFHLKMVSYITTVKSLLYCLPLLEIRSCDAIWTICIPLLSAWNLFWKSIFLSQHSSCRGLKKRHVKCVQFALSNCL